MQSPTVPTLEECWKRDPGLPPTGNQNLPIRGGPLYRYPAVHALAALGRIQTVTAGARNDVYVKLDWKMAELQDFFLSLSDATYKKSEWARDSVQNWIACDVHSVNYNEDTRHVVPTIGQASVCLYAKFGIIGIQPHIQLGICRLHP